MSVKSLFEYEYNSMRRLIRDRIEAQAEGVFEDERKKGYVEGMLEFCENVERMPKDDKEELRRECLEVLDDQTKKIFLLWDTLIHRTAVFQMVIPLLDFVMAIISTFLFILGLYKACLVVFIITIILFLFSISKRLFPTIMYALMGSWIISDKLLVEYYLFGRTEAVLQMADYRDLSHVNEAKHKWIFSASHSTKGDE